MWGKCFVGKIRLWGKGALWEKFPVGKIPCGENSLWGKFVWGNGMLVNGVWANVVEPIYVSFPEFFPEQGFKKCSIRHSGRSWDLVLISLLPLGDLGQNLKSTGFAYRVG